MLAEDGAQTFDHGINKQLFYHCATAAEQI